MRQRLIIGGLVLILIITGGGFFLFRPPQEASGPIEAIPLDSTAPAEDEAEVAESEAPTAEPTAEPTTEPTTEPTAEVVEEPTTEDAAADSEATTDETADEATADETADEAAAPLSEPVLYEIVPTESEARFLIDEVLRGEPVTVVGTTDQVAGQIAFNAAEPTASEVGIIQINARTFLTDNEFRNRAIKNAILLTDQYEFVTFTPTEISGLPEEVTLNEAYTFEMAGDLTVTNVTQPVTFAVTVTPVSETRLEGNATTTILYTDFNLFIPDSPAVDTIADEVTLELNFVADTL